MIVDKLSWSWSWSWSWSRGGHFSPGGGRGPRRYADHLAMSGELNRVYTQGLIVGRWLDWRWLMVCRWVVNSSSAQLQTNTHTRQRKQDKTHAHKREGKTRNNTRILIVNVPDLAKGVIFICSPWTGWCYTFKGEKQHIKHNQSKKTKNKTSIVKAVLIWWSNLCWTQKHKLRCKIKCL